MVPNRTHIVPALIAGFCVGFVFAYLTMFESAHDLQHVDSVEIVTVVDESDSPDTGSASGGDVRGGDGGVEAGRASSGPSGGNSDAADGTHTSPGGDAVGKGDSSGASPSHPSSDERPGGSGTPSEGGSSASEPSNAPSSSSTGDSIESKPSGSSSSAAGPSQSSSGAEPGGASLPSSSFSSSGSSSGGSGGSGSSGGSSSSDSSGFEGSGSGDLHLYDRLRLPDDPAEIKRLFGPLWATAMEGRKESIAMCARIAKEPEPTWDVSTVLNQHWAAQHLGWPMWDVEMSRTVNQAHLHAPVPEKDVREDHGGLFESCAVVSNSGIILRKKYGSEIDKHDHVFRFNFPTYGGQFAEVAGTKHTVDVFWHHWYGTFKTAHKKDPELVGLVGGSRFSDIDGYMRNAAGMPGLRVISPDVRRLYHTIRCNATEGGLHWPTHKSLEVPTSGMLGTLSALSMCKKVYLYGFGDSEPNEPYHYYDRDPKKDGKPEPDISHWFHLEHKLFRYWGQRPESGLILVNYD